MVITYEKLVMVRGLLMIIRMYISQTMDFGLAILAKNLF